MIPIKIIAQINILFIERKHFKQFLKCLPTQRRGIRSCSVETKLQGSRRNLKEKEIVENKVSLPLRFHSFSLKNKIETIR